MSRSPAEKLNRGPKKILTNTGLVMETRKEGEHVQPTKGENLSRSKQYKGFKKKLESECTEETPWRRELINWFRNSMTGSKGRSKTEKNGTEPLRKLWALEANASREQGCRPMEAHPRAT